MYSSSGSSSNLSTRGGQSLNAYARRKMPRTWLKVVGDCPLVDDFLLDKPVFSWKWFLLHFFNVLFRSVGQVVFANNPLSGLLILIACFLPDYKIGLATLLAGSIATLSEMLLQLQPWTSMRAGLTPLNSILIGCVISSLYPAIYNVEMDAKMWIFISIGSFASIFICAGFANTLGKAGIPYMTFPFNIVAICTFLAIKPDEQGPMGPGMSEPEPLDWLKVGRGVLVSMSQVFAINDIPASILMNIAVILSSPLLFFMSIVGATISSVAGIFLLPPESYQEVYDGIWGYSAILSICALSCVFFAFNSMSFLLSIVNVFATIGTQYGLRTTLSIQNRMPYFTLPFTLPTMVFINVDDTRGFLHRIQNFSYPEKQTYDWHQKLKREKQSSSNGRGASKSPKNVSKRTTSESETVMTV